MTRPNAEELESVEFSTYDELKAWEHGLNPNGDVWVHYGFSKPHDKAHPGLMFYDVDYYWFGDENVYPFDQKGQ